MDFSGGQGGFLVVTRKSGGFKSDSFEDIVDEGVQDGHASLGDASVWVNLLQHLVDVRRVGFGSLGGLLGTGLLWGLDGLLADGSSWGLCHFCCLKVKSLKV